MQQFQAPKRRFIETKLEADRRPKHMYEYYASGRAEFPVDMLRYDLAWPASGEDAVAMCGYRTNSTYRDFRSIRLRSYSPPTVERWASFGWSVGTEKL